MTKVKVKPLLSKDNNDKKRTNKLKLRSLDLAKVRSYFQSQVKQLANVADAGLSLHLQKIKTFSELGRYIYGFRWSSTSFHDDNDQALGSRTDRVQLLRLCLRTVIKMVADHKKDQKREATSSFIAFTACLHFIAEVAAWVTTAFLFLNNKTWQAWTFLSVSLGARLFQIGTVRYLQKGTCITYLEALIGITVISDAYKVVRQKTDYNRAPGEVDYGEVAALRKTGTVIIQFFPQAVVTMSVIVGSLERNEKIGGLLWVQLLFIGSAILAFGISFTKYNHDQIKEQSERNTYLSITNYMPLDSKPGEQQAMEVVSTLWYMMHSLIIITGLGTLITLTPVAVSMSITFGFMLFVNLLRAIWNNGELRYYRRMKPTLVNNFVSIFGTMILLGVAPAIMPLSFFRKHSLLGPTIFGFVWTVSFSASVGIVFFLVKNVVLLSFFALLCFCYLVAVTVFFALCLGDSWKTFFFSRTNLKGALGGELWDDRNYCTHYWNNELLLGDEDAHYAGLIAEFSASYLPWDKLKAWLLSKKNEFLADPPPWLTEEWLSFIPTSIQNEIWSPDELSDQQKSIVLVPSFYSPSSGKLLLTLPKSDRRRKRNDSGSGTRVEEKKSPGESKMQIDDAKSKVTNGAKLAQENILRSKVANSYNRRRSSIIASFQNFVPLQKSKSNISLQDLALPMFLRNLLKQAASISTYDVDEVINSALAEPFAESVIDGSDDKFPSIIVGALMKFFRENDGMTQSKANMTRIIVAAFFEIADEVSDVVLAILFAYDAKDLQWAATLMLVFMGLNRLGGVIWSMIYGVSFMGICEAMIGIKSITDTFRLITQGAEARCGTTNMITMRFAILELLHDHDANHGGHIAIYRTCDLPWKKITVWLRNKKSSFLESPPLWMTPEWFDNLTPQVKRDVWTEVGKLEELIDKVKEVCAQAKNNSPALENTEQSNDQKQSEPL
eukprot:g1933.t1